MKLRLRGVRQHYARASRPVLDGIDLVVEPGQLVAIGGDSGAGKTTCWRIAAGLLAADAGEIVFGDRQPWRESARAAAAFRRRHLGLLFQGGFLLEELDVAQNVALPLLLDGSRDAPDRAHAALQRFGVEAIANRRPATLSGGERVRAALARAFVGRPEVLLADEPTASLDPNTATPVIHALRAAADDGAAVLVVSHDRELTAIADTALRLAGGKLLPAATEARRD